MIHGPALLFCPADRPDRYAKALAAADSVIIDLEDAVGTASKDAAREAMLANPLDPARVILRVNGTHTPFHAHDMQALKSTAYRTVMLPKAESRGQLDAVAEQGDWDVVALVESSLGILRIEEIAAAPNVAAIMWGAEDLMASMRGRSSRGPDGQYRGVARHARAATLLGATAYGKLAVDAVYGNIPDLEGLAAEAEDAAASGFALKALIHPSHVAVVRTAFRPDEQQLRWAQRVLEAARAGGVDGSAVKVDGQMIDAPLLRQAEAVVAAAGQ